MNWFFINTQTHKKNAYQLDVIAIVSLCILTFTHGPDKISYIVWGLTFLLFFILNHGNFVNFYKETQLLSPITHRSQNDSRQTNPKCIWRSHCGAQHWKKQENRRQTRSRNHNNRLQPRQQRWTS